MTLSDDGSAKPTFTIPSTLTTSVTLSFLVTVIASGGNAAVDIVTIRVNVNRPPVGLPVISGTVEPGHTLTADVSGITDADGLGTFRYQWLAGGNDISGATNSTFLLTAAQGGQIISVQVDYIDGNNTAETVTSAHPLRLP